MKLFMIYYMDGNDESNYLTIGENLKEVENREKKKLQEKLYSYSWSYAHEINEIEGYKIYVTIERNT